MDLKETLFNILHMLPEVIIELIIIPYVNQYKYSISTPLKNMYFNKQLGIIFCASRRSCKLLDYDTMESHNSSIIDIASFESISYWKLPYSYTDVIYFENNMIVIYSDYGFFAQYELRNKKYVLKQREQVGNSYYNAYVKNQQIYSLRRYDTKYWITTTDANNFSRTKNSRAFICTCKELQREYQMSIHNNTLYILTQHTPTSYNIYSHNITDFNRINDHNFRLEYEYKAMTMYDDKIYVYGQNEVHIYDVITSNKIQSLYIKPFKNSDSTYYMSISNELLMLSNSQETMIYDKN